MDRQQFKEILDSITIPEGYDEKQILKVLRPLNVALLQMIPERLYKYRACCHNHIEALTKDEVWMSTSDLFNDPFDTLIQYDTQKLATAFNFIDNPEFVQEIGKYIAAGGMMPDSIYKMLSDKDRIAYQSIAENFVKRIDSLNNSFAKSLQYTKTQTLLASITIPTMMQRLSTTACFSENINSVLMWSHYSDYHKGFALGYDLRPFLFPNKEKLSLFPVVYSNKRYDANQYLYFLVGKFLNLPFKNQDVLAQTKLLLYKSKEWEYEKEWRLINPYHKDIVNKCSEPRIIHPNSIYYGCHISEENRRQLHEYAIEKNLQEFQMHLDNSSMNYEVNAVELKNINNKQNE